MAGATLTTLAGAIVQLYAGPWVDALTKETFLLTRLGERGNVKTGRGNAIRWPVRYSGNSSAASYGDGEAAAGAGNQSIMQAALSWKYNRVEVSVTGQALAVGAGGGMVTDPLRFELDSGLLDLRAALNTQIMSDGTGNSSKDVTGLRAALADTGTYAGIDRGVYTWWKAYVSANGGTPRNLTEALMRDVKSTVETRTGRVSAIYAGSAQWYAYGDLLRSERRQQNPVTLTGGYQALDFEGTPLIKVPGYPTGRMDFVDEGLLEYHMLPVTNENAEIAGLRNVVAVPGVPGFGILVLGATKDSADLWVIHYSQLVCRNPYRMGSLQDLA
jgi:hypothetical protein